MCTLFLTHLHACLRYIQRATSAQQYPTLDLADENKVFVKGHSFDGHKKDAISFSRVCALPVNPQKERKNNHLLIMRNLVLNLRKCPYCLFHVT